MDSKTPANPIQFLQERFPFLYQVYMLALDQIAGGGGEKKTALLTDTLLKFNQSKATGTIIIDYSNGKISHIDTKIRITANTTERSY